MNIKNQIARVIQRNLDIFDSKQNNYKNQDEFIRDVTDGEIYANFKKNETIGSNFSFTLFTDGISFCKKSSITVWPVLLVINEIPIERRFCADLMIVAGKIIILFKFIIYLC